MKSRRDGKKNLDKRVEEFGKGADKLQSQAVFKRYNFSLTEDVSERIDEITMITKRINRSDVVKAGIEALYRLPKDEQIELLTQVKQSR